eukprot:SAG22_NODE_793_length_7164_cov_30.556043_4_plen_629_part_00
MPGLLKERPRDKMHATLGASDMLCDACRKWASRYECDGGATCTTLRCQQLVQLFARREDYDVYRGAKPRRQPPPARLGEVLPRDMHDSTPGRGGCDACRLAPGDRQCNPSAVHVCLCMQCTPAAGGEGRGGMSAPAQAVPPGFRGAPAASVGPAAAGAMRKPAWIQDSDTVTVAGVITGVVSSSMVSHNAPSAGSKTATPRAWAIKGDEALGRQFTGRGGAWAAEGHVDDIGPGPAAAPATGEPPLGGRVSTGNGGGQAEAGGTVTSDQSGLARNRPPAGAWTEEEHKGGFKFQTLTTDHDELWDGSKMDRQVKELLLGCLEPPFRRTVELSVKHRSRAIAFASGLEGLPDGICAAAATYDYDDELQLGYIDLLRTLGGLQLGIGSRFVADLVEHLWKSGATSVYVFASQNAQHASFWAKCGFVNCSEDSCGDGFALETQVRDAFTVDRHNSVMKLMGLHRVRGHRMEVAATMPADVVLAEAGATATSNEDPAVAAPAAIVLPPSELRSIEMVVAPPLQLPPDPVGETSLGNHVQHGVNMEPGAATSQAKAANEPVGTRPPTKRDEQPGSGRQRSATMMDVEKKVSKRPWSKEEDEKLLELVEAHGAKNWPVVASHLSGRVGKQCRER